MRQSPRLWKDIVPVAFHVNYWDDLGWTDSLASPAFTTRQRDYAAAWGADSVYTPAFVLNGREWRDRDLDSIPASEGKPGTLSATLHKNGDVQVTFLPSAAMPGKLQAFVALLGYGVTSDVKAGENSGRTLIHDFVALDLQKSAMTGDTLTAVLHLPVDKIISGRTALAVWISAPDQLEPLQALGGNL